MSLTPRYVFWDIARTYAPFSARATSAFMRRWGRPTPVRATKAEEALVGHEPTPDLMAQAAEIAKEECNPISDIRGSASYRQALVEVLVRRTLEQAVERAQR